MDAFPIISQIFFIASVFLPQRTREAGENAEKTGFI